ncbi:type II secretion system protein [bacterium]|nr:type II secretion system protein [bacterium]
MWDKRGFTLIELLVVITIMGILTALALPNFLKAKDKAFETQVKSNLRVIETALHRFSTDHEGLVPGYLWGGKRVSWGYRGESATVVDPTDGHADWMALDPLVRGDYLSQYPVNPFVRIGGTLCGLANDDPRFGCMDDHLVQGFGMGAPPVWSGTIMGNVSHDPNFPSSGWHELDGTSFTRQAPGTYFVGDGNPQTFDFLPGQFLYRSYSQGRRTPYPQQSGLFGSRKSESSALADGWVLGVWGSVRSTGKDLLCSPMYQTNNCMPGLGSTAGEQPYGTADIIYGDSLPNTVFRDSWDVDNDGNLNDDDCDGSGQGNGPDDCDANEGMGGGQGLSMRQKSSQFRAGMGNPDGQLDGIIVLRSSVGNNE